MQTIVLTIEEKEKKEEGIGLMILSGPVEYTGQRDTYRVPTETLRLLQEHGVSYELLSER